MLRSAFAILAVIVLTVAFGIPAAVLSLVYPPGDWVIRLGRLWARGICAASGVVIDRSGIENLPASPPFILISNHQSHFDLLAFILGFPVSFRVVAKRFLFYIPIFGWCLWASGMIPIDREKRASAFKSLERAAVRARTGVPILFFAEGTRSPDGALLPFKKGAFVIAVKSGIPIVPVSISGSHGVLPRNSIRIRPGRIGIRFGPAIRAEEYTLETKEALIARVRDAITAGVGEMAKTAPVDPGRPRRDDAGGVAVSSP